MARQVTVLGAGMIGVSVAWYLVRRGFDVTLIDRQAPGQETSFGNAGLIQREAVRPYPFPRDLATLVRVLPNRQVDIRYRPGGVWRAALPLFQYWRNSGGSRYARLVPEYAALIQRCLDAHGEMIEAAGAESLIGRDGWLEVYRTNDKLAERLEGARQMGAEYGVHFRHLDAAELAELEPDLTDRCAGAIHWLDSWTVADPGALVQAYARAFEAEGGRLLLGEIQDVRQDADGWQVDVDAQIHHAEDLVLALGPWSRTWLEHLGLSAPMFVKRGYHMHYAGAEAATLRHWVMDAEVGYVMAPMKAGIRLTTGAELERLEAPPHHAQLAAAEGRAQELLPLGERLDATPWKGARPCMPDMKPVIGPAPGKRGLWCSFGHGHHGFTLGPATGQLLSQMIAGDTPDIEMAPYRLDRF